MNGFACVLCIGALSLTHATARAHDRSLPAHIDALAASLGDREQAALARIRDLDRRLLALRSYLRAGENLKSRWSWSTDQIRAFEQSPEHDRLVADIDAVRRAFEQRNPGYSLYVNTQVRSLDTQLERWNSNPRVARTAASLRRAVEPALKDQERPSPESTQTLRRLLANWRPSPAAPLAAPGLSMHGQSKAIDFQIMQGGRIVAATEVGAVSRDWEATGWRRKLKQAIADAGGRFEGPLQSPNEPWHYEYAGSRQALAASANAARAPRGGVSQ